MPFGILTEADVLALISQGSAINDTYNLLGGGVDSAISVQALADEIVRNLFDVDVASATTNSGDNTVTVTLSPAQVAAGFTTDHIVSHLVETLDSTIELSVTDTDSKTSSSITYRLSGVEIDDNGHQISVTLRKSKV